MYTTSPVSTTRTRYKPGALGTLLFRELPANGCQADQRMLSGLKDTDTPRTYRGVAGAEVTASSPTAAARKNNHDADALPELCRHTDTILLIRASMHPELSLGEGEPVSAHGHQGGSQG